MSYIGLVGTAKPKNDDLFQEFSGVCIGVRNGNLQIRDQEDNVFEIDPVQFAVDKT